MKRLIILLTALLACVTLSYALNGKCGVHVTWELAKDGTLTISGKGSMKNFSGERPWRSTLVTSVIIKEGVTMIGKKAFKGCRNLTSITIPSSVIAIGDQAFYGCKKLALISIPYRVTSIGNKAFKKCIALSSIDLPGSVNKIGDEAFAQCESLTSIKIPSSVWAMGPNTFIDCAILHKIVELPELVSSKHSSRYGLDSKLVESYWEQHKLELLTAAKKEEEEKKKAAVTQSKKKNTVITYGSADIDQAIPQTSLVNGNTFAVIIANENYSKLAPVPYALNDGQSFAQYCSRTLGLPEENIRYYQDATYGTMIEALNDIKNIDEAFDGEIKVLFYYAGHGAPEEATQEAYLLPIDAFKVSKGVCLSLAELFRALGDLKSPSVTVFLDACFSGATRDEEMLASARAIAIEPKNETLSGNVVVLSATTGVETALPYKAKGHGLFTYFLLKKLQESRGEVLLGELCNYITEKVNRTSTVVNRKHQTPTVIFSSEIANSWQSWNLH